MTTPEQKAGLDLDALERVARDIIAAKRTCSVCDGDGYVLRWETGTRDCGGCDATGEVSTYGKNITGFATSVLSLIALARASAPQGEEEEGLSRPELPCGDAQERCQQTQPITNRSEP